MDALLLAAFPALGALVAAAKLAYTWATTYHVEVWSGSYYDNRTAGRCVVGVTRRVGGASFRVAAIDLQAEDSDEQLVAAKLEAKTKARLLNGIKD